ncbi:FAD-dependent oxidoreductase [Zavarzinella formosa]|uniref:FAD-dependent oxidoreductase n=1 Tax=Zavarzinella formosa TaxID=360055 RepID=UPI0002DAFBA5|nr:FAD-dependent oxidoreductase [Zavarzinella formosa]
MAKSSEKARIAILGAGPIGLEAALAVRQAGHPAAIYEKGDIAEHIHSWGHVRLFSPFGNNVTPLGLETIKREHPQHKLPAPADLLTGNDFREAYLLPLAMTSLLGECLKTKTHVVGIGRSGQWRIDSVTDPKRAASPFRLLLRDDKNAERIEEADVILDCTGTYSRHAWIGNGGIPALGEIAAEKQIAYGLDDILGSKKAHYSGKSVLVIGGGYSAATTVCNLAQLAEQNSATWVIWLTRSAKSTPMPRNAADAYRERERLAARANNLATRGDGNLEHQALALVEEVISHGPDKGFRVTAKCNGKPMVWEVDRVIGNVGHLPDHLLTRELHVGEFTGGMIRHPEPGYFVLGQKSHGRDPNFLLKRGHEQVREALSILGIK